MKNKSKSFEIIHEIYRCTEKIFIISTVSITSMSMPFQGIDNFHIMSLHRRDLNFVGIYFFEIGYLCHDFLELLGNEMIMVVNMCLASI